MKVLAVILAILAISIAALPQFTDCESQGRQLTLADGRTIPMKCHWTARAELATGFPLFTVAAIQFFSKRRETHLALGILGAILGAIVILLPTSLIGVCLSADMLCNSLMKPALILIGSLVVVISLVFIILGAAGRKNDQP
jgi:hypothetical protein